MTYDAERAWSDRYAVSGMSYPCEYLIRIFKGVYPRHNFDKSTYAHSEVVDISCGDGRDVPMLAGCGFKRVVATEITQEIVDRVRVNLQPFGIPTADVQVGVNHALPFENESFDYVISWNACYYMQNHDFLEHVQEFARVCKPGGKLVLSIPANTAYIYQGADVLGDGYCVIKDDYFGLRNGERMRIFADEAEIRQAFAEYFNDFTFASVHDDCFGLNYHWHLGVATRRSSSRG